MRHVMKKHTTIKSLHKQYTRYTNLYCKLYWEKYNFVVDDELYMYNEFQRELKEVKKAYNLAKLSIIMRAAWSSLKENMRLYEEKIISAGKELTLSHWLKFWHQECKFILNSGEIYKGRCI